MIELAVEIDRTALCVHVLARADHAIRERLDSIGAPRPSLLVVLAPVLARRPFTFGDVVLVQRYNRFGELRHGLDAHVAAQIFVERDGEYEASPAARDAASFVLRRQGELITEAWGDVAADLVAAIVDGVPAGHHSAFDQQRGVLPEPVSEAHRLLTLVTALRYLKSDVHATALERHGISPVDAPDVERRWRDGESIPARDDVEADTDADFVALLGGRDEELLALLRTLPGVDPRD